MVRSLLDEERSGTPKNVPPDVATRSIPVSAAPPFDAQRLDRLMAEGDLDVVLATSKHSIQYLLGGCRYFFYDYMDAHGLSRYLPVFVYVQGEPDQAAYVASPMEAYER